MKVAHVIEVAKSTSLKEIIPEYPGPNVITSVLEIGRGRQKKESEKEMCL